MYKIIISIFLIFIVFSTTFALKITEVYFDGTNEYIGIYNNTNSDFNCNIILSGVKSSIISVNINIPKNKEIIVGDTEIGNYFSGFNNYKNNLSLKISDTKSINIKILSGSLLLDSFFCFGRGC